MAELNNQIDATVGQKAIRGTVWMLCSFGLAKAIGIVSNIVLARLLFPDDFGVFVIAGAVFGVMSALGDLGTAAAVVYEQKADVAHTNSAFWIGTFSGVLQSAVVIVAAPWIAELYGNALLRDILIVLSVVFVVKAVGETHHMLLSRDLRFKAKAVLELVPGLFSAVVSVIGALLGFGVWSLVFGMVVGATFPSVLAWRLVPWRPTLALDLAQVRAVLCYGKSLMGLSLLIVLTENIDYMIVGRLLGTASLGLYSQGFRLASYPETTVVWAVQKVAFPTFSRLRDDQEALHVAFLKIIQYLALVSFPLLTVLMILAPQLVLTLYGPKWEGTILPLQILCFLGMSHSVTAVSKDMLMAVGRPDLAFKCNLVALPATTIGVAIGTQFGIVGVAVAMTSLLSIGSWAILILTNREIDLSFWRVLDALRPAVFSSLLLFSGLLLFQMIAPAAPSTDGAWNLVNSILLAAILYLLSLLLFGRKTLWEAREIALSFRRNHDDGAYTGAAG
ncbi:MAG: lipopolysaccharide biosynthesis protein [Chloroflexi bacterium]|nr:lipopolysaccharide biosynthesis protein [Chloroflexota bacterium]